MQVDMEYLDDEKNYDEAKTQSRSIYYTIFNIAFRHIRWPKIFNFRKKIKLQM